MEGCSPRGAGRPERRQKTKETPECHSKETKAFRVADGSVLLLDNEGHPNRKYRGLGNRILTLSLTLLWRAVSRYSHKQSNMGEMSLSILGRCGRASSANKSKESKAGWERSGSSEPGTETSKPKPESTAWEGGGEPEERVERPVSKRDARVWGPCSWRNPVTLTS